jgi:hypothetical protein
MKGKFLLFIIIGYLSALKIQAQETVTIPADVITDKIRGGLLGQMLGNLNGIPHEMKYIQEPGTVKNYVPALPFGATTDDDTDFEWVYVVEMQKQRNVFLSPDEITSLWKKRINRRIWCANRYARFLMDIGFKPPHTGYFTLNPWADFNISGQFLAETYGLMAPAMPQTAAKIGLNYTTVAIGAEPAQTTQLFTSMISKAFEENDINKILDAGTAALDPESNTLQIVNDIRTWRRQYPDNWKETRRLLRDKYTRENGKIRDKNGTELNTGAVIAALLYGEGDFAETVKLTFNMGWDADCNAATAGAVVGVMYGYRKMLAQGWQIVDRYRNTTRDSMPMDETITGFADRIIELFEMVNENNGGKKTVINRTLVYEIPKETPAPIIRITSPESQKQQLTDEFQQRIYTDLLNGDREGKARAAYLAVCLDMNGALEKKYPGQWKEACHILSGYWKIMDNIFWGDSFVKLNELKEKFIVSGFATPPEKYTETELEDPVIWKEPVLHQQ